MNSSPIPTHYQPSATLLSGRNILVTGAGDGIGKVAAQSFAAHGATVILLGRTQEKLEAVYDGIVAAGHPVPILYPLDLELAELAHYQLLRDSIETELGALHGLLHNASLLGQRTPIADSDPAQWQRVMQVNVTAQMLLTRAMLPVLENADSASVVFTSSGVGRKGKAYWGAYAVSKFATEGLMQVLADELENTSSTRVNSLNPGGTRTAMRAAAYPAEDPATLPTAASIMPAYLYLMGDDSKGINGQALSVR
ncbi:YciK family oxidoreductase [Halieaceae bacterium IMCC14734]|uniref:YciK family oxidoreductase n=1 Tax=Candidatus Litorirhabdus singularis TaxID=2518993 RepID=A0ABT3TFS9_9GAMM|nr:YciK family oxidoreductase [Candidatus Litorirhabdus singularis]MCX2981162.1 YciK family oxidoreductase [Candidatus Litorirhabdus singularis]